MEKAYAAIKFGRAALFALFAGLVIPVRSARADTANIPSILYDNDIAAYKKTFEFQDKGRWKEADKKINEIKNDALMGYVLHQRYMSPYYTTKFSEARDWLIKYSDQPNAQDIYKLGLRKGAKKDLKKPMGEAARARYFSDDFGTSYQMIQHSYKHLTKKERGDVSYMVKIFNRRLRQGYTKNAREILENPQSKRLFARKDYLRMQAYLAFAYFLNNEDDMAILWAGEPSRELNFYLANWALGLVYWRAGEYAKSRDHFKNVAFTKQIPTDVVAAAAYWAWRANERIADADGRDYGEVFLETAANYPKTFYGILAAKKLGRELEISWEEPRLTLQNTREIISWQGGVRSLALLQLDMKTEATAELRLLLGTAGVSSPDLVGAVLAVAELANMPHLSINVANYIKEYSEANTFASCTYPILDVELEGGWKVDRALVNAVIRQESRFNPMAKSGSGARGLMQIMPATASFIMRDSSFRKKRISRLFELETNLTIGQTYIEYLLASPEVSGNLFKFLLAYNAGPGNLRRQAAKIRNPDGDPLFFIESISIKETRLYIKRVMANFWIYRHRMGHDSESLEQLAVDEWPIYAMKDAAVPEYTPLETQNFEELIEEEEAVDEADDVKPEIADVAGSQP
ncbi:MAG: lytic transglycosylase domain-containing protein [Rickettsiales bacterium]|jgi:soluble lytic murein transglycosylase-like protein|nr:lytic transglycosylase domain-containing protein [Rickettsiales bacterium]